MTQVSKSNAEKLVAVIQIAGNERQVRQVMEDGSSLILGSDSQCGIVLNPPRVAARHCVVHMEGGKVFVTDWYSDSGTFVNGEKIYCETQLHPVDQMDVGPFQIRYATSTLGGSDRVTFHDLSDDAVDEPVIEAVASMTQPESPEETSHSAVPSPQSSLESSADVQEFATAGAAGNGTPDRQCQLDQANAEIERLRRELEYQRALVSMNQQEVSPFDDLDEGDAGMMRAEVEQLQLELARRDQEIEELLNSQRPSESQTRHTDNCDSERLVERLDQLLEELHSSDERVRNLETLLQSSEDATHAEREEREQLACWVSEIESRIAEREQQWQAQQERLEAMLQEATARYQRTEQNADQVVRLHADEFQQNVQKQVVELTHRNEQMAAELAAAKSAHAELEKLVEHAGGSKSAMLEFAGQQEELKNSAVEIAQERASLARQRAELAKLRDELESAAGPTQSIENPDCRIRQFREHLREIHENEKREREQRSLGRRITRLWRRVDGN